MQRSKSICLSSVVVSASELTVLNSSLLSASAGQATFSLLMTARVPPRLLSMLTACALGAAGLACCVKIAAAEVPPARDVAYPGTIVLKVDATNLGQQMFRVRESVPVRPGPMTLLYPEWLPGNHAPHGPLVQLAGLIITGKGKPIEWTRDPANMYAFHLVVPAGVSTLEASYQFLSPLESNQGRITMTSNLLGLQWNAVTLYPAGYASARITVEPSVTLPDGWQFGSALELAARIGNEVRFKPLDQRYCSPSSRCGVALVPRVTVRREASPHTAI